MTNSNNNSRRRQNVALGTRIASRINSNITKRNNDSSSGESHQQAAPSFVLNSNRQSTRAVNTNGTSHARGAQNNSKGRSQAVPPSPYHDNASNRSSYHTVTQSQKSQSQSRPSQVRVQLTPFRQSRSSQSSSAPPPPVVQQGVNNSIKNGNNAPKKQNNNSSSSNNSRRSSSLSTPTVNNNVSRQKTNSEKTADKGAIGKDNASVALKKWWSSLWE